MDIKGKRFLVIGGAGFIGSHLVDQLCEEGAEEIRIFDNFTRGSTENFFKSIKTSIKELAELVLDICGVKVDIEFKVPDYSFKESFGGWYLCGVSKLCRRELHDRLGWYNNDFLGNDHELYLRFALNGVRFKHIAKTLYSVRTHDGREENVHSESNWAKLLNESRGLVKQAREALTEGKVG